MKYDQAKEVVYLRDTLEGYVSKPWSDEVARNHREKYDILTSEPVIDDSYPLFSATLDYSATGEGRTLIFVAQRASSLREFLESLCGRISGYFAIGVTLHRGVPEGKNHVYDYLVSLPMMNRLEREIEAIKEGKGSGISILLEEHVNYS